jgi:uncharacterized membrane protein
MVKASMQLIKKFSLYFLSISIALYAAIAYLFFPLGSLVHPAMRHVFEIHQVAICAHIFFSAVALLLGPFQFSSNLRNNHLQLHRYLGRTYLLSVLFGGISGLVMAQYAFGGLTSELGFGFLSLAWLFSGFQAYVAIRKKDITNHRRWMIINFSLTFSAVTLRVYLGIFFSMGMMMEVFYPFVS